MLFVVYFCTAILATAECYIITGSDSKGQNSNGESNIKYRYGYGIQYDDTGDVKSQSEERDGEIIKGEYHVNDPDGYIRTVRYTVGKNTGFQAKVTRIKNDLLKSPDKSKLKSPLTDTPKSKLKTTSIQNQSDSEDSPSTETKILEPDAPKELELNTGEVLASQNLQKSPSFPAYKSLEQFDSTPFEEPVKPSPLYRLRDVHPRRYRKTRQNRQQFLIWYPDEEDEARYRKTRQNRQQFLIWYPDEEQEAR